MRWPEAICRWKFDKNFNEIASNFIFIWMSKIIWFRNQNQLSDLLSKSSQLGNVFESHAISNKIYSKMGSHLESQFPYSNSINDKSKCFGASGPKLDVNVRAWLDADFLFLIEWKSETNWVSVVVCGKSKLFSFPFFLNESKAP